MTATAHTALPQPSAQSPRPLRLAVILASNREGRFGPVLGDWFRAHTEQRSDFDAELIDLADVDLPTSFARTPQSTAALAGVTPGLDAADAFVVITPEYNHSFPAVLKNLIDWHSTQWRAKPVGFVSYGGISGGLRAVEQLRQVYAEMHAVTLRDTVSFHNAWGHFDDTGRHRDPTAPDAAAKSMLDQLAWWGEALRTARTARPYGG